MSYTRLSQENDRYNRPKSVKLLEKNVVLEIGVYLYIL